MTISNPMECVSAGFDHTHKLVVPRFQPRPSRRHYHFFGRCQNSGCGWAIRLKFLPGVHLDKQTRCWKFEGQSWIWNLNLWLLQLRQLIWIFAQSLITSLRGEIYSVVVLGCFPDHERPEYNISWNGKKLWLRPDSNHSLMGLKGLPESFQLIPGSNIWELATIWASLESPRRALQN